MMAFPYFKWYPGDYARDTAHLSLAQDGAYRRLIDSYMSRGKAPHGDEAAIYRICSAITEEEQNAVSFVLSEYFKHRNGDWLNARCEIELANQRKESSKKSKAAHVRHGHNIDPAAYAGAGPTAYAGAYADGHAGAGAGAGAGGPAAGGIQDNQIPEPDLKSKALMSGKKPDPLTLDQDSETGKSKNRAMRASAVILLAFLNERTGRKFPPTDSNVKLIAARLAEGFSEQDIRSVIANRVRTWKADAKMAEYLRPKTLFGATNFSNYFGEIGKEPAP